CISHLIWRATDAQNSRGRALPPGPSPLHILNPAPRFSSEAAPRRPHPRPPAHRPLESRTNLPPRSVSSLRNIPPARPAPPENSFFTNPRLRSISPTLAPLISPAHHEHPLVAPQ